MDAKDKKPNVFLYTGVQVKPELKSGMWRASVLGSHYCSATFEGLVETISFFHSIYTSFDEIKVLPDPVIEAASVLSGNVSLEQRQVALRKLESLAGLPAASEIVARVKGKHTSFGADYITKCLGKKDFSEVASSEIFDLVPNILHREELIRELAERVKL